MSARLWRHTTVVLGEHIQADVWHMPTQFWHWRGETNEHNTWQ